MSVDYLLRTVAYTHTSRALNHAGKLGSPAIDEAQFVVPPRTSTSATRATLGLEPPADHHYHLSASSSVNRPRPFEVPFRLNKRPRNFRQVLLATRLHAKLRIAALSMIRIRLYTQLLIDKTAIRWMHGRASTSMVFLTSEKHHKSWGCEAGVGGADDDS